MHIAVCDDDKDELSRVSSLLVNYCSQRERGVTYETFQSAVELLETMGAKAFDLLLLDIIMPGLTGMEAARAIRRSNQTIPIIFLTSSRDFAVESYRVHAEDYILKPANEQALFLTLDKQLARLAQEEAFLLLKTSSGLVKQPLSQIVYVEVINHTVRFVLCDGTVRETYGCLADCEAKLMTADSFCKPHRSYIVNLRQMTGLEKAGFLTASGKIVPVSRDAFAKTKIAYMKYLLDGRGH